jgi:hypothetical protein
MVDLSMHLGKVSELISNIRKPTIKPFITKHVAKGAQTYADEYSIYNAPSIN